MTKNIVPRHSWTYHRLLTKSGTPAYWSRSKNFTNVVLLHIKIIPRRDRLFQVKIQQAVSALYPIKSEVPQNSVLVPLLYTLHTSDFPITKNTLIATFEPHKASNKLQQHLNEIEYWLKTQRIKINSTKSTCVTFTTRKQIYLAVKLNNDILPQQETIKYLDRKVLWKTYIRKKIEQLIKNIEKYGGRSAKNHR